MKYRNIRDYLEELDRRELLIRVTDPVNKDHEMGSLVRWQFRGLKEEERKGWLFENVTDSRGRTFDGSVAMAIGAASPQVYAAALGLDDPEQIPEAWANAEANPLEPVEVDKSQAPVKEVIILGDDIQKTGGIDQFPVPVLIPGYDVAAYFTCPVWITKDPETGDINAGIYRVQVKSSDRAGVAILPTNHGAAHWRKARARGEHLEAALCLSPIPTLSLSAATKLPPGSEFGVAGALNGAPLEVVRCETVDLMVPAQAEIVIEGRFRTDILEMEGPFGEFAGYGGESAHSFVFEVTAITHRKSPVLQAFISEMPPSESSLMRRIGWEAQLRKELQIKVPSVREVRFYEEGGAAQILAISMHKPRRVDVAQALHMAAAFHPTRGKWIIAVDDDIDITDVSSLLWALAWRVQPHRDTEMQRGMLTSADPSAVPPGTGAFEHAYMDGQGGSRLLIDATLKWGYPPVSLPTREHMERARDLWEQLGLPALTPQWPWYGYDLGNWPKEHQEAAKLATEGRYLETGEAYRADRVSASYMETGKLMRLDPEPDGADGANTTDQT